MAMLDQPRKLLDTAGDLNDFAQAYHEALMATWQRSTKDALAANALRSGVAAESQLRDRASEIVIQAEQGAIDGIAGDEKDLEQAIEDAGELIRRVALDNAALVLVASVVGLSAAIATRSPSGVAQSLKAVKTAIDGVKAASPPGSTGLA